MIDFNTKKFPKFANLNGSMAEWLGSGLQNRLRRFESAWNLTKSP